MAVFDMILHIYIGMMQSLHLSLSQSLCLTDSMNTEQSLKKTKNTTYFFFQEQRTISSHHPPSYYQMQVLYSAKGHSH